MTKTVLALSLFNKIIMDRSKEKVKPIYQIQLLAFPTAFFVRYALKTREILDWY